MGRKARGRAFTKPKADLQMPRRKHGVAGLLPETRPDLSVSTQLKKRAKSGRWFHRSAEPVLIDGQPTGKFRGKTYRRPKAEGK